MPPSSWYNGWPAFFVSLVFIGIWTAVVGELASLFGCVVGLGDAITAITFVALGTSLPDTFASRLAMLHDEYADASVGNVTGSNSVNVFLGLGMPWTIGALYWAKMGPTEEWKARYPDLAVLYPDGGFAVPAGDLGYSVTVFTACALVVLVVMAMRRKLLAAELGGPPLAKYATAILFVILWIVYLFLSIQKTLSHA